MNILLARLSPLLAVASLATPAVAQQFTFSVDWKGPIISQGASFSNQLITEGDILTFGQGAPGFAPLGPPGFALSGGNLGLVLYNSCVGHLPGQACGVEVDAISQGADQILPLNSPTNEAQHLWFSVDEFGVGVPQAHLGPTVFSEGGAVADVASDVFVTFGLAPGPLSPTGAPAQHVGVFDGDGGSSNAPSGRVYPGIGLVEPTLPNQTLPSTGDNLDALNLNAQAGFPSQGYFISVDGNSFDPLKNTTNSGTSTTQGVSAADVLLVSSPTAAPVVFAPALSLGLDLFGGPDSDDIDALVLAENGNGTYDVSLQPYDWVRGNTDMLLFSVRRGSAVIGQPDSIFGLPIEEGDILVPPVNGGLTPFPGILYAAETLGLVTSRTHGVIHGDDIDGIDFEGDACFDCNNNGVEDAVDIATGSSSDANDNGIPDECEAIEEYGFCAQGLGPCNNDYPAGGCANRTGQGSHAFFQGTHSVAADDLKLTATSLPPGVTGLFFMGNARSQLAFGDGLRGVDDFVGPGLFRYPARSASGAGIISEGRGIVAYSCAQFGAGGCIQAGDTWNFQCWYRDTQGPCGSGFNTSNGLEVQFGL